MVDDTSVMPERPLTFSDAMRMTWLSFWLAWRLAVALLVGWLLGGATVSSQATARRNGNGAIVSDVLRGVFNQGETEITVTIERSRKT